MLRKSIAALGLCIALAAGALAPACAPQVDTENYAGQWELAYGSEEGLDTDSIALAKSLGSSVILDLQDNGTGTLDLYGEVSNLTWTASSNTEGNIRIDGMGDASMQLQDGGLSISDSEDGSLTFTRP